MHSITRVALAVCLASVGFAGCSVEDLAEDHATEQELTQAGHVGGAVNAFDDARFRRGTSQNSELYWYMDTRDAALWANDPDCPNNDCGNARFGPIPSGESVWDGLLPFADAMCWASRNPDHFTFNSVGGRTTLAGSPPTAEQLAIPVVRNAAMRGWLAADANVAISVLRGRATEMAGWIGRTNRDVARSALRAAFNACHYAMDTQACGHSVGNIWCDPAAANPSPSCERFVRYNISSRGPLPNDGVVKATISSPFLGYCTGIAPSHGVSYPVGFGLGVQYAAAERYIRHHTTQSVVEGADEYPFELNGEGEAWIPGAWGAPGQTSSNGCIAPCESGECAFGSNQVSFGGEAQVVDACADVLEVVRNQLDANPLFFMSPQYEKDPVRQCRQVSNAKTCQWAGGTCSSATFDGSAACVRNVDYFEGSTGSLVIGTCDEGVSFGGALPASCVNDEHNTVPPVPVACARRCKAVKGYLTSAGKCLTTTTTDYARTEQDVTAAICGDLVQAQPGGAACEPYTQPELCALAGGFCTNDGNNACVRTFTNQLLYPGQQQPTTVWNIANYIGSCSTQNPFNAPAFAPSCSSPEIDWPNGPSCTPNGAECISGGQCCSGGCYDAFGQTFTGSSDGSKGTCRTSGYPGDYAWLDYGSAGAGAGQVSFSTGGSCTGDACFKAVPRATTVSLTATPTGGSTFQTWQGCDSASGTTCNVASTSVRTVKAVFAEPCNSGFWDVPSDHGFCPYIKVMKAHGVVVDGEGCASGAFCPGAVVGRRQMAAFVIRAKFGESFPYTTTPYFTDVPWYDGAFKYVQKLRDTGITMGCTATSFDTSCVTPDVTRGQSAVFLMRAKFDEASWDGPKFFPNTTQYFQDVPATHGFFRYIQELATLAITSGCASSPQRFCPDNSVTRGEMAVFLTRSLWPGEVPAGTPLVPGGF